MRKRKGRGGEESGVEERLKFNDGKNEEEGR